MARSTTSKLPEKKILERKVKKAFGALLREYRQAANMSQQDLSSAAALGRKHIHLLEKGSTQPRLDTLLHLMRVFGDDTAELVTRTGSLVLGASPRKEQRPVRGAARVPLGEDTCPGCLAVYSLHARRVPSQERRKFKCGFCKRAIAEWSGTTAFSYRVQSPPKNWD
jgi:transcriptional regulator with XRE-family HTH domain